MKILFCKWGNVCESDFEETCINLQYDIASFSEPINSKDYDTSYLKGLVDTLLNSKYDCIFSINFLPILSRASQLLHLPYICWIVDSPWFQLYSKTIYSEYNYIFTFDKYMFQELKVKIPNHVFHLPLGGNVRYFDKIIVTAQEKERFSADVSFVGSLYKEKHDYDKVELPEYLKGYLLGVMEAQLKIYGYNFIEDCLTNEIVKEFKCCANWLPIGEDYDITDRRIVADEFLGKKCCELERYRMVQLLANKFKFKLFTTSDTNMLSNIKNMGVVDTRCELPKVYKSCKININTTMRTIRTGISQRVLDIMATGSFVLTNYQKELEEIFEIGKEIVVYKSEKEMIEKIKYYLDNEEERLLIAKNGYKKVKNNYSSEKQVAKIFKIVFGI